jgi:hypothetical protein
MGRRSRARQRAATEATRATRATGVPAAGSAAARHRRGLLGLLNPFRLKPPSRSRVGYGAAGFGLSAVLFAVIGWVSGQAAWFNSAVLLAILALAWGLRAAFMGRDDRSS